MSKLQPAVQALSELTHRLHSGETSTVAGDEGLRSLVDVIDDIGRAVRGDTEELRGCLPYIAAGREALESHYLADGVAPTPMDALTSEKDGASYAAGALWALSAVLHASLSEEAGQEALAGDRSGRQVARDTIRRLLDERDLIRPQEALDALQAQGYDVDRATVSRTLGDLMAMGVIEPASPPPEADRRHRWYRKVVDGFATPPEAAVQAVRRAVRWLVAVSDPRQAQATAQRVVAEETA